jgi:hypothetical protein
MATTLYFRDVVWGAGNEHGRWGSGTNLAALDGSGQGWGTFRLHTTRGSTASTRTRTTVAGPTLGLEVGPVDAWVSAPLAAAVTISGNITSNLRMSESVATTNAGAQIVVERIDNLGAVVSTVLSSEKGTELSTSETAENWSAAPTSTAFNKGDRIRVRIAVNDAGGTLETGRTITLWQNGPTAGASGDSYITFNETLSLVSAFPAPVTTIYLTDSAGEVDPNGASYDSKDAWTSRGAGTVTATVNTAAGWTAPLLWTVSAGGNFIEWFTHQLNAFTLAGVVKFHLRGLESNVLANASFRCEIAVTNSSGAAPTVWAANTFNVEMANINIAYDHSVAGADLAVTDGQRLRIRVYLDDSETAALASTYTAQLGYADTAVGTGDSYLEFGQSLTELVTAPPKSIKRNIGRPQAAQRASRW